MRTPFLRAIVITVFTSVFLALPSSALAQLAPDQLYYGIGQRVVVFVSIPEGKSEEPSIKLHNAATLEVIASASAAKGRTDLSSLFPSLWTDQPPEVMLAQLYLDDVAFGSPLVIQPLVTPNTATRVEPGTLKLSEARDAEVMFSDERRESMQAQGQSLEDGLESVYSGVRVYVEQEAVLKTSVGEIVFRLRPDAAPNTAYNFMHLVGGGFYSNVIFHRVVETLDDGRPFVIQVGDPSGTGSGGPGYMIDLEKSPLEHTFGVLSMARAADPNTNGSQIFVCLSREGTSFLDNRYTSFAQAVSGAEVIQKIAQSPVDANDRPLDPPMIERAFLRDAPAISKRSMPVTRAQVGEFTPVNPDR